jgi:hypothetical protein
VQFQNGGEYDFSDEKLQDTVGINPQNRRTKWTQFWELQKGQNSKSGTALDKILFRIWYLCWNLTTSTRLKPPMQVRIDRVRQQKRFPTLDYQMRNRILSKAVPDLEFCPFCNSQGPWRCVRPRFLQIENGRSGTPEFLG